MGKRPQARAIAAEIIASVLTDQHTLSTLLPDQLKRLPDRRDQALTQQLCYGVMREYFRLDFLLRQLLERSMKPKDMDIQALILIGLYQLIHLRMPAHAAVAATVGASQALGKPWATGLVNAILRRYQRESEHLLKLITTEQSAKYSHPDWLLACLKQEYSDHWRSIVTANNTHPPMSLRINRLKTDREHYLARLMEAGMKAAPSPHTLAGLTLEHPVDVQQLPGFDQGLVSIQDLAAQLAPTLLDLQPGLRVLDACASPGGKLAHMMETEPQLAAVTGVEIDPLRLERLQQSLQRLGFQPELVLADSRQTSTWWNGRLYDRILLDAPCSATGVIRRHPDIKLIRTPEEVETAAGLQRELLHALWPLLGSGGKLLYATCSVLRSENDLQIEQFIQHHDDARVESITAAWGIGLMYGRQILPGQDTMDGFYYALLKKI